MAVTVKAEIKNKYGFHVRPSTQFSQLAKTFSSSIEVQLEDVTVDGESVMELMTLGATCGTEITIIANGEDEEKATETLATLINDQFGGIE